MIATHRIQSVHNPRLKALVRLRDHRTRMKTNLCLVEDMASLRAAARCGVDPIEVFVWPQGLSEMSREWVVSLPSTIPVTHLNEACRRKIALGEDCATPVAVFPLVLRGLDDCRLRDDAIALVLDALEKPGNIGAILRTADALGVDAVILCDCPTDPGNPHLIRAARGAFFSTRWTVASAAQLGPWLKQNGFTILAGHPRARLSLNAVEMGKRTAFIIGREDKGWRPIWKKNGVIECRIPQRGVVDSLNASVAAAIFMYEACRRRGWLD